MNVYIQAYFIRFIRNCCENFPALVVMATLHSRGRHYIFVLWFLLLSFFLA